MVKNLIEQCVDCNFSRFNNNLSDFNRHLSYFLRNVSHFDRLTNTFISPIQLAAKLGRHEELLLLYEHRNSPTKLQLEKRWTFYINHYDRLHRERNEILFDYTVSRLLYTRITTEHTEIEFDNLIPALRDIDNASHRGRSLSDGSRPDIFLQVRIYTLVRTIIDKKINKDDYMIEIIEKELLHNLETYYFIIGILLIPVDITKSMMNQSFSQIKSSQSLLIKYYRKIAKNLISKIKQLEINDEYTIPTGWKEHAVCVSFRRTSQTHFIIRIDNPSSKNPPDMHEIKRFKDGDIRIKPKILGQLHVHNLDANLNNYFVLLIDSVKRDLTLEKGRLLIYNLNEKIRHLEEIQTDNVPWFIEQANVNCVVKCFEPGLWLRIGEIHQELYYQLLDLEKYNLDVLARRCKEEHIRKLDDIFDRFNSLAEDEDINSLPTVERTRLQIKLKNSYKQYYKHLSSNTNIEHCPLLDDKYVHLRFEHNITRIRIELKNLSIKSHVLILGEAGCGKTTACQYITYSWAIGKLWRNKFEWLFYIKTRNLNSEVYPPRSNKYSLIDIIEKECFTGGELHHLDKQKLTNLFENSSDILWILDGCDERTIPTYLLPIEQELFDKSCLILTSRPYATYDFHYDIQLQILSFTDQDIEKYIYNYFSYIFRTTARECWSFISDSRKLLQTACVPACLEIICSLWETGKVKLDDQMTIGELYQKMCDHLLQQYLLKFHRLCNSALAQRDIYQEPNAVAFAYLECLAFDATKEHRFTITGKEITNVAGQLRLSVLQIVLLIPQTRNSSPLILENIYYFVHRTFQEYLSARYMVRMLESFGSNDQKKEVIRFITYEKYNRRIQHTFRLFFELKRSPSCIEQFWSTIDSEPRDLVGLRHCSRIAHWFPNGTCSFSAEDQNEIDQRANKSVLTWISNTDRLPNDIANTYIFESFVGLTGHQCWIDAWKEDLFIEDPSKRHYFLVDLWSEENIKVLKENYDHISNDFEGLHDLIETGPNTISLKRFKLPSDLFILYEISDETEFLTFLKEVQEQAKRQEPITTRENFQTLLDNYDSFANLNRQSAAHGSIIWKLKIAPSALKNINNETLHRLAIISKENLLFFRYFKLPMIYFLNLYANENDMNYDILSIIISITMSSDCILTASPEQKKLIRVHEEESFTDIEMNEHRRSNLIHAFEHARNTYGYSSFFRHDQ
ncbi:unnamed protein product [Rotaria sordida]|uniref:NACHT domain-containing protein n=1 Tax=Rotaria sordida TaxID=392033 RepID=A0A814VYT6_9BILA|nr:unnamed protein product [Rotaria sordida]